VTVIKYEKIKINLVVANQTINKLYYSATFLVIFVLDRFGQCNSGHVGMASIVHWTYTAGMHRHLAASTSRIRQHDTNHHASHSASYSCLGKTYFM